MPAFLFVMPDDDCIAGVEIRWKLLALSKNNLISFLLKDKTKRMEQVKGKNILIGSDNI